MQKTIIYLLICLIGIISAPLRAEQITFNHLTTEDGLSQFSVNALYSDENGVLWIGTREGLNRYDGHSIQTYKFHKNDPSSLFSNVVLRIVGNQQGKIYLLCTGGVAELDLTTQKFKTLKQGNINAIYYDQQLFIAIHNEIHSYDEKTGKFSLFAQVPEKVNINTILHDGQTFWLGTNTHGVYSYNIQNKQFTHPIAKGNIASIYKDSDNNIWIGSWEEGLYCVSPNQVIRNFQHKANSNSLSSDFVRAICEDNLGNLWIGTFNGLNKYNKKTGEFSNYTSEDETETKLTHSSIWCIVKDKQGTLWLGTYFGGVNFFNPEYENYNYYRFSNHPGNGLSSPIVGRMVEDNKGNLWIATEGGGLNYYDRESHQFKWFKLNQVPNNNISPNNLKSLYYDQENDILWIGTHLGGLYRFVPKTGQFTNFRKEEGNPHTLPSDIVRDIEAYGKDSLIIATQNGVCTFNRKDGRCTRLFQQHPEGRRIQMVADVAFDKDHNLWIAATGEGVFRYNFQTSQLKNYRYSEADPHSISNNSVNNINPDSKGNLWFATSGSGLDLYHPETDNFENFDKEKNGLASDCIYNTQESPLSGHLLLITNEGFSIFDQENKSFSNYNTEKGLPLTAINENALYITQDGEIFLGGVRNMISFHEKDLKRKPKPYKILLNKLIVNGEEIKVGDENGILSKTLEYTPEITLKAHQSMFSIEFATPNYIAANKSDIIYQLEGFSKQWNSTRNSNTITYTNLNAGDYTLIIKAKDTDESICKPVSLKIRILPPVWRTPLAYLVYFILISSLLIYLFRTYQSRLKLRESLKYEKKHRLDIEALNQSKLRFFTNISHEFRTPLTLIITQIEVLLQSNNFTPQLYSKVLSIYKNSIILRELVTELLDFRKQEQGHMKLKVSSHNIIDFMYENYLLFNEYANKQQIKFEFKKEEDNLTVWYDAKQMQKVINNLLSNAFKHTKAEGSITLSVHRAQEQVIIEVADTGRGIPAAELNKIFERFYQIDTEESGRNESTGTGIGLALTKGIVELHHGTIRVESTLGQGSKFIVTLPLGNKHFSESEICQSNEENLIIENPPVTLLDDAIIQPLQEEEEIPTRIPNAKIVIAEDNEALREVLVSLFAPYYQVFSASNGEDALELIRKEMPNIVVSDVVMPKLSGTALCKMVKEDFNTSHIPIVLLTARTTLEQNIEGLLTGADDYISKPFNTRLLIARCNNLVNSRIILQEKFSKQPQATPQMLATNLMDKEILDKALSIIEEHLDDTEFNINAFAKEMGMARTNLFTKLKAITGQTPNEFILSIRLKKGAWMLRNNPELNIGEISDRIGFSSSRYFSKCFKDMYNINPLAYRKGDGANKDEDDKEEEKQS